MQNFKELTDPSKLNRKPEKIRLKKVNQASTLEESLRKLGVAEKRLSETAILNGMNLKEKVAPETLLKVIME